MLTGGSGASFGRATVADAQTSWPVTAAEFRTHARVSQDTEDPYIIGTLIPAATRYCQNFQGRQYMPADFTDYWNDWPWASGELELRWGPVGDPADVAISYYGADDVVATWASSNWMLDVARMPPLVVPYTNATFPALSATRPRNRITVTYTAGYQDAAHVPDDYKLAIKLLATFWYRNREAVLTGSISKELEFAIRALLGPQRVWRAV